jgi:hypothetical protein
MQAKGPTPKNRGRKAAENGLKIRPLPYHRVGKGLGKPEIAGFALSCVRGCAVLVDFAFPAHLTLHPESCATHDRSNHVALPQRSENVGAFMVR